MLVLDISSIVKWYLRLFVHSQVLDRENFESHAAEVAVRTASTKPSRGFPPCYLFRKPSPLHTAKSQRAQLNSLKWHGPAPHNNRKYGPAELSLLKFAKHGDSFGKA